MEQIELMVHTREVLGKKVRFLRRQGIIPIHLFGHNIDSMALQCDIALLQPVLAEAEKTRLISLKIDKLKKPRNVMVRDTQIDPITGKLLHVDFYQVRMEEKIKVEVPIDLIGEAPALKTKGTMLLQELDSLNIECLPGDIPTSIKLDVSSLIEAEQAIHVRDIRLGEGISILDEPDEIVVKIGVLSVEKVEEKVTEKVAEAPEVGKPAEEIAKEE